MSDYPQYPTDPSAQGSGDQAVARGARPATIDTAIKLIWANVALGLVSTVVTFIMLDSIVDQALEDAGLNSDLNTDTARSGAIIGAVIGFIISVGIALLLAHFIGKGASWARIVYTVIAALGILFSLLGFASTPMLLLLLSVVGLAITAATLFFLWKPESSAYFSAR